jgi:hypothetical protein
MIGPIKPIQQIAERKQISCAEGGLAVGDTVELVRWLDVGQTGCNRV